jgi:hypothetical protein
MKKLLELQQVVRSRRRRAIAISSVASCLTFAVLFILAVRYHTWQHVASGTAAVTRTVDLWNAGTGRGVQAGTQESISLPAAKIEATVILPAFSPPGQYVIAVARSQNGEGIVAEGQSLTESVENRERVHVDLDLHRVKAGKYFLSTTHEQDQASYYYPLEIK